MQSLIFAKPIEGLIGSGITYIVGANNSGKTTLIEGVSIKNNSKINSSDKVEGFEPEFLVYDDSGLVRGCKLIRSESNTIKEDPQLSAEQIFEIISSRRHWESISNSTFSVSGQGFSNSYEFKKRENSIDVASELKFIESDDGKYWEFIALVKRVIPEFTRFSVGYDGSDFIEYISGLGIRHKTDLLGDGVITAIRILLHLFINKSNPLIIDEPELSLHPASQKKLLRVIAEYSQKRQIILSTHSPYFINWEYLKNGAALNRIVKIEDKNSLIFCIKDFSRYESLIRSANWQQPYLLDEVAKEILFMDENILFLEGQEDVGLLTREEVITNANIFGYGVRGKDNFRFALNFAKDLGYKKVCCVLDNGTSEFEIKSGLEADFSGSGYKIVQWNKDDIRDKDQYTSTVKNGYFTAEGRKKNPEDLDDFESKVLEINQYFQ
jgi:predicted ATP-dependent endonuclease of OLD family